MAIYYNFNFCYDTVHTPLPRPTQCQLLTNGRNNSFTASFPILACAFRSLTTGCGFQLLINVGSFSLCFNDPFFAVRLGVSCFHIVLFAAQNLSMPFFHHFGNGNPIVIPVDMAFFGPDKVSQRNETVGGLGSVSTSSANRRQASSRPSPECGVKFIWKTVGTNITLKNRY